MDKQMVGGEPVDVLVKALASFKWRKTSTGMIRVTSRLEHELGEPFLRALMRVESEMLAHDPDPLGRTGAKFRTPEQRRADALVVLVLRVTEVVQQRS